MPDEWGRAGRGDADDGSQSNRVTAQPSTNELSWTRNKE
jgi:hypothetical protein